MVAHKHVRNGLRPLVLGDPATIGSYTVLGRLGTGGMGVVYLGCPAKPAEGDELVAIKTLHPVYVDDPEVRERFRTEAEFAKRAAGTHTARLIEDASDLGDPYLVTEFIQGPPLSRVVNRHGALPPDMVLAVAIGIADALCAIHEVGVAHRDLKPANVLLAESGPRIIDFGIAHELDASGGPTKAGVVMGSPGWIAPERLSGGPATAASDVFCWGLLVAYAATGKHPYGTGDMAEIAGRIMRLPPDLAGMSEPLLGLVRSTLVKDPSQRPTAEDLLEALLEPLTERNAAPAVAGLWEPPPPVEDDRPSRSRQRVQAGVAALGAAAAAAITTGLFMNGGSGAMAERPPRQVEVTVTTTLPGGMQPGQNGSGRPGGPGGTGGSGGPGERPTVASTGEPTKAPGGTSGPKADPPKPPATSNPKPPPEDPPRRPPPETSKPPASKPPPSQPPAQEDNGLLPSIPVVEDVLDGLGLDGL